VFQTRVVNKNYAQVLRRMRFYARLTDSDKQKEYFVVLSYYCHIDDNKITGYIMAYSVSWLPHTIKAHVHFQASPCGTYGAQSSIGWGFSLSMAFHLYVSFSDAPHSFIHLSPTLNNMNK
jgi:hypothetical protein